MSSIVEISHFDSYIEDGWYINERVNYDVLTVRLNEQENSPGKGYKITENKAIKEPNFLQFILPIGIVVELETAQLKIPKLILKNACRLH